jgi:copper chaperone CopZ
MHTEQIYSLTGLHCDNCVRKIEQALQPFADEVSVSLDPMHARLSGLHADSSLSAMQAVVASLGQYQISILKQKQPVVGIESTQVAINKGVIAEVSTTSWLQTYRPLLLILAFILGASVLVQFGQHAGHGMGMQAISGMETMRYFMAGFFLVFAFFKLLDLRAFADAYAGYDLLAARWHGWGYVYPFVELALGMAYLANFLPTLTAWITLLVMGFSAIGVIRAVMSQTKIRCACLGTVFQLPMSTVTIVEDVGMVLMAVAMLSMY